MSLWAGAAEGERAPFGEPLGETLAFLEDVHGVDCTCDECQLARTREFERLESLAVARGSA